MPGRSTLAISTARDAQRWLDEVATAVVTGQYVDPSAGKVLWSTWTHAWMQRQTWVDATPESARTSVRSVPWWDATIGSVTPAQVQAWVAAEQRRGLAPSTIKTRLNYVQMAFRAAVADRTIITSPAAGIKPPRSRRAEATMHILGPDEVRAVLGAAGDFRGFVEVCIFAGLRLGEAAGLQLRDINFLGRSIRVDRQVYGSTIKAAKLVPPKYHSERTVYVPGELTASLSAHVANTGITGLDEMLFTTPLGRMWNRNSAAGEWRRIRDDVGLPDHITLHALRHTFASNLIAAGCDVVTVQRALGHSTPSITLNVYSHLWPSAEDKTRGATAGFMADIRGGESEVRNPGDRASINSLTRS